MLSVPFRSAAEAQANQTFEALLWALSRPGMIRRLSGPGEATIIDALLDRECRAYSADPVLMPQILRTGAALSDVAAADHVFLADLGDLAGLDPVQLGSDLYPDDGATVVVRAAFAVGQLLRLSGPGVDGTASVQIGGLPQGFWQKRAQLIRYPMGFDLILLDGDQVMGLPRSTAVEEI